MPVPNGRLSRLVLATANPDKAAEIRAILQAAGLGAEVLARPLELPEVEEDGSTLEENARKKAEAIGRATGLVAVADDTGLFVDALGGAPGVRSARYAGEAASYEENCTKLLRALEGVEERTATFRTCALAYRPLGREVMAFGEVHGAIALAPKGGSGFGYDPIFVPDEGDGRTFAELAPREKDVISHRGRAFRALAKALLAL